ncbi:lipopolysaccharide biosynthesis protein [Streptomyces varsoviensis]|uniref:lipopolysaccharide biosynthesis protein n=1 Tax=Streptomyces varsoviensis TaxID=67373 RepID=UPI0033C73220
MSDTTTRTEERQEERPSGRGLRLRGRGGGSPLFRNAYALMLNTGISASLGMGYWLVAARYYSADSVGQGSAAIAAMKLLAGLTAVTLTGALARFIPIAGRATARLVFRTYAGSSVVVAVAATVFLLTLNFWGPSYRFLHGPLHGFGFIIAVVAWSLLTLQDGVLTGLRSAMWVPVGNTVFSAAKLALLVGLSAAIPTTGVFVAWVAAIAVSVLPLGWLVFRRLVPRHVERTMRTARPVTYREMGRFLAGDYTGSLFSLAVVYLVPVIVAAQVSSADNAYFYITTTIGGTVNLLAINMGASLTVEGSHDPARLAENCRAALRRMARIMLPVCLLLFVLAPYILKVFGAGYAEAATPLLRWFAVGAALRVVMEVYFAVLRAQSRTSGLAYLQGLLCALVLGLTLLLLPRMGLTGAGVAEISSLAVIVSIATVKLRRILAAHPSAPAGKITAEVAAPDGDLADLAVDGDKGDAGTVIRPRPGTGEEKSGPYGTRWALRQALDADTVPLGVRLDFDHLERRPDVRHTPEGIGEPPPEPSPDGGPRWAHTLRSTLPLGTNPWRRSGAAPEGVSGKAAASEKAEASETSGVSEKPEEPARSERLERFERLVESEPPERTEKAEPAEEKKKEEEGKRLKWPEMRMPSAPLIPPPPRPAAPAATAATATGGAERAADRPPGRSRAPELGIWLLLAAALGLYWLPLRTLGDVSLDDMGGLGLISVLPGATLLGAALLVLAFASALWLGRPRRGLLLAIVVLTVVSLHAVPAVLESEPRFATAWQHVGFLDFIDRTGTAVPDLDARWSWPGFFAAAAFVARACGVDDLSGVLRWWPLVVQLLYLAPFALLLKAVRAGWRAKWTAAWLFALCGWVGQDYFSPQALNYLIYLLFVAVLLVWFRWPRPLRGRRLPGESEVEPVGRRERAVLLAVLIGLFAASVASHQLTPFVMLGVLTVLVLARRSTLRGLPLLCCVMLAVWVGFLAEPYWSGHFDELFGGLGSLGGNLDSSVSGRIQGGSSTHKLVLYARVALAAGVLAFAGYGWLRRRRAGLSDVSLLVLTAVPFLAFGMQSYGGEVALRVFLFALPGACVLAALAVFPRSGGGRGALGPAAALLAGLVLIFGFLVARWGNEPFERVRPGEVAAMDYVYAHDEPTAQVLWPSSDPVNSVTPAMPWGARDMERVNYRATQAPRDPVLVDGLVEALRDAGPNGYLMINRGQAVALQLDSGYAPTWEQRLLRALDARPELRRAVSNADATVYELADRPEGRAPEPAPGPIGPVITWTPMSVVGGLAAVALLALLSARELVRVAMRPGVRQLRWLQGSFWFSLPLLAVVLAALIHRLWTMS